MHTHTATPIPPIIATVNSFNTSISLNWTHDRTCFEHVPVKYYILVNTATQLVITDELKAEIVDVIFGSSYTVSVMAVADGRQRSEPDRESITAGGYRKDTHTQTPHTSICAQHNTPHTHTHTHTHTHMYMCTTRICTYTQYLGTF